MHLDAQLSWISWCPMLLFRVEKSSVYDAFISTLFYYYLRLFDIDEHLVSTLKVLTRGYASVLRRKTKSSNIHWTFSGTLFGRLAIGTVNWLDFCGAQYGNEVLTGSHRLAQLARDENTWFPNVFCGYFVRNVDLSRTNFVTSTVSQNLVFYTCVNS